MEKTTPGASSATKVRDVAPNLGLLWFAGLVVVGVVTLRVVNRWVIQSVLVVLYGQSAVEAGLRIVDHKHGRLSNGDELPGFAQFVIVASSFIVVAFFACCGALLVEWLKHAHDVRQTAKARHRLRGTEAVAASPLLAESLTQAAFRDALGPGPPRFHVDHVVRPDGSGSTGYTAIFGYLAEGAVRAGTCLPLRTTDGSTIDARVIVVESSDGPVAEATAGPRLLAVIVEGRNLNLAVTKAGDPGGGSGSGAV